MLNFINIAKKILALLFAGALFVTGGINSVFNGDVAQWQYSDDVIGLESLTRAQGVTTDGENWYFSGKSSLEKVNIESGEITALNTAAIPERLAEDFGSAHIGGISYFNGIIYAAVEDSKVWEHPLIVLYSAETLTFTGEFYELPTENHHRGVPYCITDGEHGILYAGDSRNSEQIYKYDINTFSYLGTLDFENEIDSVQGGEYYNGSLYLGTNDITRAVYSVDTESGSVTKLFDRIAYEYSLIDNFGGEGEDVTVYPLADGTLVHTLQTGALFVDVTLRHYE